MTDDKPVPSVFLDVYVPHAGMTPAAAERCVADKQAITALTATEGLQELLRLWRERERSLLAGRMTDTDDVLAANRRKARAYRLVRQIIEQVSATGDLAAEKLRGAPVGEVPQAALDEVAALTDLLAGLLGQPTLRDREREFYAEGEAKRRIDRANAVAAAIALPGWRIILGFLAGLSWAHWLMLAEGTGPDGEHKDTIAVIAAMLHNAQDVLLQGRKAEQWFAEQAGETA